MMADILRQPQHMAADMTREEARQLTDEINKSANNLWQLVVEARDRSAWKALGYPSIRAWWDAEFSMHRSRLYQILDQGEVTRALENALSEGQGSEVSNALDISTRVARDIKPVIERVTERIREEVALVSPAQARAVVDQIIKEEHGKQLAVVEGQRAARTLAEEFPSLATVDKEDDAQTQTMYGLYEALETLAAMPDAEVARRWVKPYQAKYVDLVPKALRWLQRFLEVQA